jgi:hypothetical protein
MRLTRAWPAVVGLGAAVIAVATLRPDYSREAPPWAACLVCGERGTADAILNVILFAPLGAGLALAGSRTRRALLIGALVSALAELAQTVIPGRDPSLGDVLFDTIGTGVGVALVALVGQACRQTAVAASRLSLAAAGGFAVVVLGTGLLLAPSFPRTVYWGQWTPNLGHLEWYRGRVRAARVGNLAVPSRRIAQSDRVRTLLLAGAPITVDAIAGPQVLALASLFSIYDRAEREIVLVGPDRDDVVFRYRTRAVGLRLNPSALRLAGGLRGVRPGDSLHVVVRGDPGLRFSLEVNSSSQVLRLPMSQGWTLLYPAPSSPAWLATLLHALWIAVLVAPVGFWLRTRAESGMALGVVAASLWLAPPLVGLQAAGPTLSAVAVAAIVLAAWSGRRVLPEARLWEGRLGRVSAHED